MPCNPYLSVAGALALVAGAATPLLAQTTAPPTVAKPSATVVGRSLVINGTSIYTAAGRIISPRTITFPQSPTLLVVWDEVQGSSRVSSFALSRRGTQIDQIGTTENKVRLRYASFDPLAGGGAGAAGAGGNGGLPAVAPELAAAEGNELYLVQFVATPLEEMRREITATGGEVLRFLTDNTHIIRMAPATRDQIAALPYIRWVGAYHPAYRLEEAVLASLLNGSRAGAARYSIEVMRPGMVEQQQLADVITRMGGIIETITPDQYRLEATLTKEQLLAVARMNIVNFIDLWRGPGGHDMDLIRQMGGAVPLLSGLNIQGQGVRAEVFDTGIINNHQQWNGQPPLIHNATAVDSHGMACYGIQFATGVGNAAATGFSPQREQGIFSYYDATSQFGGGPSRLTLNLEAIDPSGPYRSIYQTSSVGSARALSYGTISAEVDDYLFRADYLSFQSQSNAFGTRDSRPQAWAKNIVAVGGMNLQETLSRTDDTWDSGASVGPANDLRVKPDLAHSFGNILTTYSTSTTGYGQFGGTSGATPITAGHSGLLQQMWHEGVFPGFGGGSSVFASRPRSTTAKAMMINAAYRYTPTAANQMYRSYVGWGMADLTPLYEGRGKLFIVNADDPLENSQTRTHTLFVQAGEPVFKVTMIYPDPMGNPAAAQQRINDLSLKVTSPTGIVYWGNSGMVPTAISGTGQLHGSNTTTAGGSPNTYDTVENVFLQNPEAGNWIVEILASQVVQDGYLATPAVDAVYSLVASNVTLGPPPPTGACCLPDAPCTVMSEANCLSLNGAYRGDNTPCATANCPPVGACCFGDGTCLGMSQAACIGQSGTYRGDNTVCATANCTGACCFADGTCAQTGPAACTSQGGIYRGDGTPCSTANCPQPGACCLADGSCEIASETQCAALNGAYRGNGTTCATANCPQPPGLYVYTGAPIAIIDGTGTNGCGPTAIAEINVQDSFIITNAQTGVFIETGWQGDLRFRLSHNGVSIDLANRPGVSASSTYGFSHEDYGTANNPGGTMKFNDGALMFYDSPGTSGEPGVRGLWKPRTGAMAAFVGLNAQGVWRLEAEDCAGGIPGTLVYFNVFLEGAASACYANCDGSTSVPFLNVADFGCFLTKFAAGDPYANCDGSTQPPTLNVADFGCFLTKFAAGCSAP